MSETRWLRDHCLHWEFLNSNCVDAILYNPSSLLNVDDFIQVGLENRMGSEQWSLGKSFRRLGGMRANVKIGVIAVVSPKHSKHGFFLAKCFDHSLVFQRRRS